MKSNRSFFLLLLNNRFDIDGLFSYIYLSISRKISKQSGYLHLFLLFLMDYLCTILSSGKWGLSKLLKLDCYVTKSASISSIGLSLNLLTLTPTINAKLRVYLQLHFLLQSFLKLGSDEKNGSEINCQQDVMKNFRLLSLSLIKDGQ